MGRILTEYRLQLYKKAELMVNSGITITATVKALGLRRGAFSKYLNRKDLRKNMINEDGKNEDGKNEDGKRKYGFVDIVHGNTGLKYQMAVPTHVPCVVKKAQLTREEFYEFHKSCSTFIVKIPEERKRQQALNSGRILSNTASIGGGL